MHSAFAPMLCCTRSLDQFDKVPCVSCAPLRVQPCCRRAYGLTGLTRSRRQAYRPCACTLMLPLHPQFDQYEIAFTSFKPLDHTRKNAFDPPQLCMDRATMVQAVPDTHHARRQQALSLLPASLVPTSASPGTSSSSRGGGSSSRSKGHSIQADAASTWQQRLASLLSVLGGSLSSGSGGVHSSEPARIQSDLDFIAEWNMQVCPWPGWC